MTVRKGNLPLVATTVALILAASAAQRTLAADTAEASADSADAAQEVIVTGTRQKGVAVGESAAPIQIISPDALAATGKANLADALQELVPSFQAQGFGSDMANQTLQARLRGLSPNHVLVLVDGKRRHTTANLAVDGGSPYSGGAGVDLNFIPMSAVDHIEVLTEGAAAQYGSDAIAGVINIILKKNSSGGSADATYGGFFDGGGQTTKVEGNAGFAPTDNSFFNITAQVSNHGHTDRGNADPRVDDATTYPDTNAVNYPGAPNVNLIEGDAESHLKLIEFNSGINFSDALQFYAFGTYGVKDAESYENYRMPSRVSYDTSQTGCGDPAACAASLGPLPNGQLVTTPAAGTTIVSYPFPIGFNPLEQSKENDFQLNVGLKGGIGDWTYDVATAYGEDHMDVYTISSANNTLYGATGATPTNFYDGKFITTQSTSTADITRDFNLGLAGPLTVAFGGEYRRETYIIGAGDWASYAGGGAQSFAGYSPLNATDASRNSKAGYVDLAATPITGLKVDLAGRYEDYSDFGSATVGKFTARYDLNPMVALRGTVSSGFRAPTLAEEYYTGVNVGPDTAYGQLAPNGKGASLLGLGTGLKPEHSTNLSFGVVLRPLDSLTATVDAYHIMVTDRILTTGNINGSFTNAAGQTVQAPAVIDALTASGLSIDPAVIASGNYGINIFANGADTITNGIDLQLLSPQNFAFGHIDFSVAATYSYTTISRVAATPSQLGNQLLFDTAALSAITTESPRLVLNLGAKYTTGIFYADLHEIVYGAVSEWDNDDGDTVGAIPANVTHYVNPFGTVYYKSTEGTVAVTNLELGLNLTTGFSFAIGAQNLFNRYPPSPNPYMLQQYANAGDYGIVGLKYLASSPLGIDGGYYYARVGYKF